MIIVMQKGAGDQEITSVVDLIKKAGPEIRLSLGEQCRPIARTLGRNM
jgi:hypothetical protein